MASTDERSSNYESNNSKAHANDVVTLDKSRQVALAAIDNAKISWHHATVCVVAGVGFFTDAYDIFTINIASIMLGYVYGAGGQLNPNQDLGIKVAAHVGALVGQLLFGWLADPLSRKKMYGVWLIIIVLSTFAQAFWGQSPSLNIIGVLIVWRFITGVGRGGDHPLRAMISSEFTSTRIRGRMMTAVFASWGWGNFFAALIAFIVTTTHKDAILASYTTVNFVSVDPMWRVLIGLGCVPGVVALYLRLTISESPRFTMDIEGTIQQATADISTVVTGGSCSNDDGLAVQRVDAPESSWADFVCYFGKWENGKILFGTSWSWFALVIAFNGLELNSAIILEGIGFGAPSDTDKTSGGVYVNLLNITKGNLILCAAGLIPGYWFSPVFIDSWGRKPIQLMGFTVLTILFVIMGSGYDKLTATDSSKKAFVFLHCLASFFQNFGPHTTTYVIPGEIFPTRYRSTAHGISDASGKLGAIVAHVAFVHLKDRGGPNKFVKYILGIFALFTLTGIGSTLLLPETKLPSLEELSNEDQEVFVPD